MSGQPVAEVRTIDDHGHRYRALAFICPGCIADRDGASGLHLLPVDPHPTGPSWDWDGNLDAPTLSPSILTRTTWKGEPVVCHSFLRAGVFEFLTDCTHSLAGQHVPMVPLPEWFTRD